MSDPDSPDSILDLGFLSPHVPDFVAPLRKEQSEWFDFATRVNRKGQRLLLDAKVTATKSGLADPKFLAFLLLIRSLSNFQAVILLAERGMVVESRTIARCCYEDMYCLASLQKFGEAFAQQMKNDELASRKAASHWLLRQERRLEYAPQDAAKRLRENIAEIEAESPSAGRYHFEQIADKAEIGDMYLFYRQLSWDSAHPSIKALDRYTVDETSEIRWGPESTSAQDLADTLNITLPGIFTILLIAGDMLAAAGSDGEIAELWREYKERNGVAD